MIYQKGYKTIVGYECSNSSILNYMNYCKIKINSSDIFFSVDEYGIRKSKHMLYYESNVHLNGLFLKRYNVDYSYGSCKNSMKEFLDEHIYDNKMITIVIMPKYLGYSRCLQHAGEIGHCVNVIGKKSDKYYISDGYSLNGQEQVFEGWIPCDQILKAWNENDYQYIIYNNNFENISVNDITENANTRIRYILKDYSINSISKVDFLGFEVIKKILSNILEALDDKERCYKTFYSVVYNLRCDGFLTIKYMLIDKLKAMKIDQYYIKRYEDIVKRWDSICMALIKIGLNPNKELYQKLIYIVDQLCDHEKSLLHDVYYNCFNNS